MDNIKSPEELIYSNSGLEDQWYYASQKENSAHRDWQSLYRLKDSYFSDLLSEALSLENIKTNAAAERHVRSLDDWKTYISGMVQAEYEYKKRKTNAELIKMKYFENKSLSKAEDSAYYHEQPEEVPQINNNFGGGML